MRNHSSIWDNVIVSMQEVVPGLEDISVDYLHTKTLGLFFRERGIGRPWPAEDVSDGTIRALAILVALADPRTSLLVVEEPENSVHPWIVKVLIEQLRRVSSEKVVIITTHSPIVIDLLSPEEAWIVFKRKGATSISRLTEFDPELTRNWKDGQFRLSEYLDSGLIPQATPILEQ